MWTMNKRWTGPAPRGCIHLACAAPRDPEDALVKLHAAALSSNPRQLVERELQLGPGALGR